MPDPNRLSEKNRAKLDGIVQEMISNNESDDNIQFVVNDFKQKYAEKKNPIPNGASSLDGGSSDSQSIDPKTGFPKIDQNGILPNFEEMDTKSPVANKQEQPKMATLNKDSFQKAMQKEASVPKDLSGKAIFGSDKITEESRKRDLAQRTSEVKKVVKIAKTEIDDNLTEERLQTEKEQTGVLNTLGKVGKSIWNNTLGAFVSNHTGEDLYIDDYKPLQDERKKAKEDLRRNGLPITEDAIQKGAEDIFREEDKMQQLHARVDANLPSFYNQEGIWKELNIEGLKKNQSLKTAINAAQGYSKEIEDFNKYAAYIEKLPKQQLTQAKIDKYNDFLENAQTSQKGLEHLQESFPKLLKEVKDSEELLQVTKYNYNDLEKSFTALTNVAENIGLGTLKILAETSDYTDEKLGTNADGNTGFREDIRKFADDGLNKNRRESESFYHYKAKNINNFSDLGSYTTQLVSEQAPILATLIFFPEIGLPLLSTGTAGQTFSDMEFQETMPGAKITTQSQKLFTSIVYGTAEGVFEGLGSLKILKNIEKSIARASTSSRRLFYDGSRKEIARLGKQTAFSTFIEGSTEYLTSEAQIAADRYIAKKDISAQQANENRFESTVAGGIMGGGMSVTGGIYGAYAQKAHRFSDSKDIQDTKKILARIESLSNEIKNNPNLTKEEKKIIRDEMFDLTDKSFEIVTKNAERGKDFSDTEAEYLENINLKQAELKEKFETIKNSNFSKEQKEQFTKELNDQFNSLESDRNTTLKGEFSSIPDNRKRITLNPNNDGRLKDDETPSTDFTTLSTQEQTKLKDQAARELIKEKNPDGKEGNFTVTDEEITQRAVENFNKANETKTPTPEAPQQAEADNSELNRIEKKLDNLKQTFLNNGKSDKESDSLALQAITEEERQVLRDSYNADSTSNKANKKSKTVTLFHGTANPLVGEFDTSKSNTSDTIFLTDNENFANEFSFNDEMRPNGVTYTVTANLENTFDSNSEESILELEPLIRELVTENYKYKTGLNYRTDLKQINIGERVIENPTQEDFVQHYLWRAKSNWRLMESPRVIEYLKSKGYDSFTIKERGANNIAVFDKSKVKFESYKDKNGNETKTPSPAEDTATPQEISDLDFLDEVFPDDVPNNQSDIEAKKADIERRKQEDLKEQQYEGLKTQEDLTNYNEGETSIIGQGLKEIRDDIVNAEKKGLITLKEKKLAQAKINAWLTGGMSLAEASVKIREQFGITVSAGKWQLAENRRNEINAKYDAELKALEEQSNNSQINNPNNNEGSEQITTNNQNPSQINNNSPKEPTLNPITDQEFLDFVENDFLSDERLTDVATKVRENKDLTNYEKRIAKKKEKEIFDINKKVEEVAAETKRKEDVNTLSQIPAMEKDEFLEYTNTEKPTEQRLNAIAYKNANGIELNNFEKEVYQDNKKVVDKINKEKNLQENILDKIPAEQKFTAKESKYTVAKNGNELELFDNNGQPAKVSPATKQKYFLKALENGFMKRNEDLQFPDGITEAEAERFEIDNETDPGVILQKLQDTEIKLDGDGISDYKDFAIASFINKVTQSSFVRFGDRNSITRGIALTYFSKQGQPIDTLAQEISESMDIEVTPEDIVDFIVANPNGKRNILTVKNPVYQNLIDKFVELTGFKPTPSQIMYFNKKEVPTLIDAEIANETQANKETSDDILDKAKTKEEFDNWFSSLTPQEQVEFYFGLEEDYPNEYYQQRYKELKEYEQFEQQQSKKTASTEAPNGRGKSEPNGSVGKTEQQDRPRSGNDNLSERSGGETQTENKPTGNPDTGSQRGREQGVEQKLPSHTDGTYQIYTSKIKENGELVNVYLVPTIENKNSKGIGDDIYFSLEDAIQGIKDNVQKEEKLKENKSILEEEKKKAEEELQAKKEKNKDKTNLELAQEVRVNKVLDKQKRYDGVVMTRREYIEQKVKENAKIVAEEETDTNALNLLKDEFDRINVSANQNSPSYKRKQELKNIIENENLHPKKIVYKVYKNENVFSEITKIEYDYYQSLVAQKTNTNPTENKKVAEVKEETQVNKEQEKLAKRLIRDEKAEAKLDDALAELRKELGFLNSGINPMVAIKGAKVVSVYIEQGIYKLSDITEDLYNKMGELSKELFDAIKQGYASFRENADDETYSKLDENTRGYTYESLINKTNNNEQSNQQSGEPNQPATTGTLQPNSKKTPQTVSQELLQKSSQRQRTGSRSQQSGKNVSGTTTNVEQSPTGQRDLFSDDAGVLEETPKTKVEVQIEQINQAEKQEPALVDFSMQDNEQDKFNATKKYNDNIGALETLLSIIKEKRKATAEEKNLLAKYVGFGGLKEIAFNPDNDADWKESTAKYKAQVRRVIQLTQELDSALGVKNSLSEIRAGILTAHYTPKTIIDTMFSVLEKLGFQNGNILEPSAGIGNFIGYMPSKMRSNSNISAVELDNITGNILKHLYDDVNSQITGIQDALIPDNSQDVVISNVPFGAFKVFDKAFKGQREFLTKRIHNYFFAKALDKVREGGIVMFVTSKGVLDSKGNQNVREYLNQNADFLGAVRLPSTAFQNNANTSVVTDVIILRKNTTGEKKNPNFIDVVDIEVTDKNGEAKTITINKFFAENKNVLLGEIVPGGMYSEKDYSLIDPDNKMGQMWERVSEMLDQYKNTYQPTTELNATNRIPTQQDLLENTKDGNLTFSKEGKLLKRKGSLLEEVVMPSYVRSSNVKKYIDIRNALFDLIIAEYTGQPDVLIDKLRQRLNFAYNSKRTISAKEFNRIATEDGDGFNVLALEDKNGKKADILSKRTINPLKQQQNTDNIDEAIIISLYENAKVDMDRIAELMQKTVKEILELAKGKIFESPTGGFFARDEYLSGNVKKKLAEVNQAIENGYAEFEYNKTELEAVIPKDIPVVSIEARLGSRWVPLDIIQDFAQHLFNDSSVNINYAKSTDTYNVVNNVKPNSVNATEKWGTKRRNGLDLLIDALHIATPVIYDTTEDKKRVVNKEETEQAVQKYEEIRAEFENWIYRDAERRERLGQIYNEKYNTTVRRKYEGSHLNIPGINGVNLYPHQKDAIWMLLQNNGGIIDHIVGAGKTFVMVAGTAEMKRTGVAKKPMILALKSTIPQIVETYKQSYPLAKILAPSEKDFQAKNRQQLFSQIAINDWDVIIMSHENYQAIPHHPDYIRKEIDDEIATIEAERDALEGDKKALSGLETRLKNLEARLEKLTDVAKDNAVYFQQTGIDHIMVDESQQFKNLAYMTKQRNVAGLSKAEGSRRAFNLLVGMRYLQETLGADKGTTFLSGTPISNSMVEMYSLLKYMRPNKMAELGFNTFDQWATTFANPTNEIEYTVTGQFKSKTRFREFINVPELSLLYNEIADVRNDDNLVLDKPKMKGDGYTTMFIPMNDQQRDYGERIIQFAKTKDGSVLGLTLSENQKQAYMLLATNLSSKMAIDMRLINKDFAYDPNGKVGKMTDEILKVYTETNEHKGTQLIFSDLGTPKNKNNQSELLKDYLEDELGIPHDTLVEIFGNFAEEGYKIPSITAVKQKLIDVLEIEETNFDEYLEQAKQSGETFNLYTDIKQKLIDKGIPENEIVFIHSYNNQKAKEKLFEQVNNGEIRVVLGSTQKLGTGVNVQKRLAAIHHLDVPWRPSDMEQRNGRGIRQGNWIAKEHLNNVIPVYAYATERTLDGYKYQLLQTKQRFLDQVKSGNVEDRTIRENSEDGNDAYAIFVAELSGNKNILTKFKLEQEKERLTKQKRNFDAALYEAQGNVRKIEGNIPAIEENIAKSKQDIEEVTNKAEYEINTDKEGVESKKLKIDTINGEVLQPEKDSKEAKEKKPVDRAEYGKKALELINEAKRTIKIGEYTKAFEINGLPILAKVTKQKENTNGKEYVIEKTHLAVLSPSGQTYTVNYSQVAGVLLNNIQKAIEGIPSILEMQQRALEKNKKDLSEYKELAKNDKFPKEEELSKVADELKEIDKKIQDFEKNTTEELNTEIDTDSGTRFSLSDDKQNQYTEVINGFYSPLEKIINETKFDKLPAKQWIDKFAKGEEAKWTGLTEWLSNQTTAVSKTDIQNYLKDNRIEVKEVVKGIEKEFEPNWTENEDGEKVVIDPVTDYEYKIRKGLDEDGDEIFYPVVNGRERKSEYEYSEETIQRNIEAQLRNEEQTTGNTKFSQYQLEGDKENYKEVLVTMPKKRTDITKSLEILTNADLGLIPYNSKEVEDAEQVIEKSNKENQSVFKSSHFEEPNILVHLRMNTRTDAEGNKVLFIEEFQRDVEKETDLGEKEAGLPFSKTTDYVKLAWKVALKEAVSQGVDKIAWTTGEQQNERYDLRKQVDYVDVFTNDDGTYEIEAVKGNNSISKEKSLKANQLESLLGKDLASKIIEDTKNHKHVPGEENLLKTYRGNDLAVGGKGMKGFYGSPTEGSLGIVGNVAKSLFKQEPKTVEIKTGIGEDLYSIINKKTKRKISSGLTLEEAKEEVSENPNDIEYKLQNKASHTQHSITITTEMRAEVQSKGQPLFMFATRKDTLSLKEKQLQIINSTNPAPNNYNTWIRSVEDIKTAEEAFKTAFEEGNMYSDFTESDMKKALNSGKVTVYSSKPIREGVFVTPSKMNAEEYAGGKGSKVYSKEIDIKDLAWIDESEGQYAPIRFSTRKDTRPFETINPKRATKENLQKEFPDAVVVQNESELPASLQSDIKQQRAEGKVKGVYHNGEVYLVADNLKTIGEATGTYRHEALGHKGVIEHLGTKLNEYATRIIDNAKGGQFRKLQELAAKYGLPTDLNALTNKQKQLLGEEYIAYISQNKSTLPKAWNDLVSFVREAIRKFGIDLQVTDTEIQALIGKVEKQQKAKKELENQNSNNTFVNNESKYSKTRLDIGQTMGQRAVSSMVGRSETRQGLYKTIQASNTAGSVKPDGTIEEIEDLESRGINPYWDKKLFQNKLKEEAIKNNLLLPTSFLDELTLIHDKRKNYSAENDVYLNKDGTTITKVNDLTYVIDDKNHQNLSAFFDRIYAHNELFDDVTYKFKGFIINKHNEISVVFEQPFINSTENATQEEIDQYFINKGFIKSNKRKWSNAKEVWTNGKFELFDARPANVLKGKKGELYFIDTFPHSIEYLETTNNTRFHLADDKPLRLPQTIARQTLDQMRTDTRNKVSKAEMLDNAIDFIQNSNWYKNLEDNQKARVNKTALKSLLVNSIKDTNYLEDKIEDYKQQIKDNKLTSKQVFDDIIAFLKTNQIKGKITPTEINRLIKSAAEITTKKDTTKALDDFMKQYQIIKEKALLRVDNIAKEKAEVEYVVPIVESLVENGYDLDMVLNYFDTDSQKRMAEVQYHKEKSKQATEEERVNKVNEAIAKQKQDLHNATHTSFREGLKKARLWYFNLVSDRSYVPANLMSKTGMQQTYYQFKNTKGYGHNAKEMYEKAHDKIWKGLTQDKIELLNDVVQMMRIITIDNNREQNGLSPVQHPNNLSKIDAQAWLDSKKTELGDKAFNDIQKRAKDYFKAYQEVLDLKLEHGFISQETYDALNGLDYQPRLFLHHAVNFDGDLSFEQKQQIITRSGLSKEQIKRLEDGSDNSLIGDAQWLLSNSIATLYQDIADNTLNKLFIAKEFPIAKEKYDTLLGKTESELTKEDKRFIGYFKELSDKVIPNEIMGFNADNNNPIYKNETPNHFVNKYYWADGVKHQFFMEENLAQQFEQAQEGFLKRNAKEIVGNVTGSRILKFFATGNNPLFVVVNTPRDFMWNIQVSEHYSTFVPLAMAQMTYQLFPSTYDFIKSKLGRENTDMSLYFKHGGSMDYLHKQGEIAKKSWAYNWIMKPVTSIAGKNNQPIVEDKLRNFPLFKAIGALNEWSEIAFRIATFRRSVNASLKELGYNSDSEVTDLMDENGIVLETKQERLDNIYRKATYDARSILDFSQGGRLVKDLEEFLPYTNVAVQAARSYADAMKKRPVSTTLKTVQMAVGTTAGAITLAMYMLAGDDDEPEEEKGKTVEVKYVEFMQGISKDTRAKYYIIPTKQRDKDGNRIFYKIAKDQMLIPYMNLVETLIENRIRVRTGKYKEIGWDKIGKQLFSDVLDHNLSYRTLKDAPLFKAGTAWYAGYDLYRDKPLDKYAKTEALEGMNNENVEDFYKYFGRELGISPIRTKSAIESVITSPHSNPYLATGYEVMDYAFTDKSMESLGKGIQEMLFKGLKNRTQGKSTEWTRTENILSNTKDEQEEAKLKEEAIRQLFKDKAQEVIDGKISEDEGLIKLQAQYGNDYNYDSYEDSYFREIEKTESKEEMTTAMEIIKREDSPKARVLMIQEIYGDINSPANAKIKQDLEDNGVLNEATLRYLEKKSKQ